MTTVKVPVRWTCVACVMMMCVVLNEHRVLALTSPAFPWRRRSTSFVSLSTSSSHLNGFGLRAAIDKDGDTTEYVSSSDERSTSANSSSKEKHNEEELLWTKSISRIAAELNEAFACATIALDALVRSRVTPEDILHVCDALDDDIILSSSERDLFVSHTLHLRTQALKFSRYHLLVKLIKTDYDAYIALASFASPSRIPRMDLPNVQDVPYSGPTYPLLPTIYSNEEDDVPLVQDCSLEEKSYQESLLDKLLLSIFRKLVVKHTNGVAVSSKPGMSGLVEQAQLYMLQPNQTSQAQHDMVKTTLGELMTPILPPFYRIFMSGIVPTQFGTALEGRQLGPWWYAPYLTSLVTPLFFSFLVGPSRPNRRKDGNRGGLVVEKCRFLQESNCKGICLHQCKGPAQEFFRQTLGMDLSVRPNFVTQECQWSFGEKPLPVEDDPTFPRGCLMGCQSRKLMASTYRTTTTALSKEGSSR